MVDLTDVPGAAVGDEVILWGEAGEAMISVNDVARLAQTISYEMLCTVGKRVPRVISELDDDGNDRVKITRALLGVSDKAGVANSRGRSRAHGVEIVSTGGTMAALEAAGVKVRAVENFTGSPEMLDGRVKTLHPKIHGGILARRADKSHRRQMARASGSSRSIWWW